MEQFLNTADQKPDHVKRTSLIGKLALLASGAGAFGICAVALPFISPAFRRICLPYVPATDTQIRNIASVLRKRQTKVNIVDLGSGDGRVVFEAAKLGFSSAVGVELNPWLVVYSRVRSLLHKRNAQFIRSDLWRFSLSPFSNVVIFGVEEMMSDLEKKFCAELRPGSWVVACRFPVPGLKPILTEGTGIDTVWVYEMQ
ncbi:ATP synthase subunit C lysine N-methyltransferase-like [Ornithodoros turicata]|uniref:ATP synthase subunit C lysine N-methyltransferase-like n=1 Tax=Ornithodoros turicata TaxID=34597 RepID=UPI00313A40F5